MGWAEGEGGRGLSLGHYTTDSLWDLLYHKLILLCVIGGPPDFNTPYQAAGPPDFNTPYQAAGPPDFNTCQTPIVCVGCGGSGGGVKSRPLSPTVFSIFLFDLYLVNAF